MHTDLGGLECQALHHSKEQNACPVADRCWAEPQDRSLWCRSDTYEFPVCLTDLTGSEWQALGLFVEQSACPVACCSALLFVFV